jgi:hypothetical protein
MKRTLGLITILVLAGCNSGSNAVDMGPAQDLEVPPSTDMALHGPSGTASFNLDVKPILTTRRCFAHHMTTAWNPIESLTDNAAIITFLTSTKTEECKAGLNYVTAGDPANSFLYEKLNNTYASTCGTDTGAQMPLGGPFLYDYEIAAIKSWIMNGAMNN